MEAFSQIGNSQKWYDLEGFPIYFIQGERIYLKFESPTDLLQIYGQNYGPDHWEWFSSKQVAPAGFLLHLPESPSYRRITPSEFEVVHQQYLAFHKKLCA